MSSIRRIAALAAVGLVSAGLGVVAAQPASAAAPALAWEISQQFDDHLSTHALSDGATEDADGVITFPGGTGTVDPETGAGTIQYEGSVAGSFVVGPMTYYQVTIADPAVTVDEDGNGEITAVVSASNAAAMGNPAESTDPARVVVTTFDADGGWAEGVISTTPHWAGVLPEGAESQALGIPAGQPVDGKAFAPEFLGQITRGVRPHFYASGANSDPKKAPSAFSAVAADEDKTVEAAVSYGPNGVSFDVVGSGGFTAEDEDGTGEGVYIGLAPSGGLPPVDDMGEDQDNFAAANWVAPAQIQDGAFASSMTAAGQYLKRGVSYSIYTWRAHEHTSTSQDTETPVEIDWSRITLALKATWKVKPTTKKDGILLISGTGKNGKPDGSLFVKLTKGSQAGSETTVRFRNGKRSLGVTKLAEGKWKATITYRGTNYLVAKKSLSFRI